jgi:hypothetical protein
MHQCYVIRSVPSIAMFKDGNKLALQSCAMGVLGYREMCIRP